MKTYKDIQGWFDWYGFMQELVKHYLPSKGVYVEVGIWKGKSFAALAALLKEAGYDWQLHGVDLFQIDTPDPSMGHEVASASEDFYEETDQNLIDCGVEDFHLIRADSAAAADFFDDEEVDLVFIDALHTYEAVKADTLAWMPKLKKGGFMLWHDIDRKVIRTAVEDSWGSDFKVAAPRTGWGKKR